MPLFIPVLIGVGIASALGYGGKKGYDGVAAMRDAKRIGEEAEGRHRKHVGLVEAARDELAAVFKELQEERRTIAKHTLGRMIELLEALERRGKIRGVEDYKRVGVDPEQVRTFAAQYVEAGGVLKGTIAAAGAGAGASTIATGAVSALASASTGAAISGLSGAAAQSAILAWLGGGSLAAGGGGMALGSLMLGGITVAPAVLVGGFVLSSQGEKARTKAIEYRGEVDRAVAKMATLIEFHERGKQRAAEVSDVTRRIDIRAKAKIEELIAQVDRFDDTSDLDLGRLSIAMLLSKALSDLLQARIIGADGELDPLTVELIARHAVLLEAP
jgi:hypothetical protein